jgi:outer membrane protein TolC
VQISYAQVINTDTLVYPLSTKGQSFENYLVSLAWNNNPEFKTFASELKIAQTEVQIAKRAWADDWNITLNLNENNLNTSTESPNPVMLTDETIMALDDVQLGELRTVLESSGQAINVNNFPRYNFGLTLNLGSLLTRGKEVDIAEERLFIEQLNEDQGKFEIRAEVFKAYLLYTQTIESLT